MDKVIAFGIGVLLGIGILISISAFIKEDSYDVTINKITGKVHDCKMPDNFFIVTDGSSFSWLNSNGYRSLISYGTPLEACIGANASVGKFKQNWKYLK